MKYKVWLTEMTPNRFDSLSYDLDFQSFEEAYDYISSIRLDESRDYTICGHISEITDDGYDDIVYRF